MQIKDMRPRSNHTVLFTIASLLFMISACGGGGESSSIGTASDTGSISFNLKWQNSPEKTEDIQSPSGNVCTDYAIETVKMAIYDSSMNEIKSESWPCSTRHGTLGDIDVGENYTLHIEGIVAQNIHWRNETTGVSIKKDQDTYIGTAMMIYIGDDGTPPIVSEHYPATDQTDIPRNTRITATFSEIIVAASVNLDSCSMVKTGTTERVPIVVTPPGQTALANIKPEANLEPNTSYTVTITTDIQDLAGLNMTAPVSWAFTTSAIIAPPLVWDQGNWDESLWQ